MKLDFCGISLFSMFYWRKSKLEEIKIGRNQNNSNKPLYVLDLVHRSAGAYSCVYDDLILTQILVSRISHHPDSRIRVCSKSDLETPTFAPTPHQSWQLSTSSQSKLGLETDFKTKQWHVIQRFNVILWFWLVGILWSFCVLAPQSGAFSRLAFEDFKSQSNSSSSTGLIGLEWEKLVSMETLLSGIFVGTKIQIFS